MDKVTSEEKKIITFKVYSKLGMTIIEESNYYEDEINFKSDFPKTSTKNDTSMIHGYGMKLIKYLVKNIMNTYRMFLNIIFTVF